MGGGVVVGKGTSILLSVLMEGSVKVLFHADNQAAS